MAALLSLSTRPTPTPRLLRLPASPFKGNVRSLRLTTTSPFPSLSVPRSRLVGRQAEKASSSMPAVVCLAAALAPTERFRLNNLAPQPGSRKRNKRKGRGIAAGQGNSCGFGMRGQKSTSGPGVRKGFECGRMPLYRRIPNLRGIAGRMHAGLPKFVPVNLKDIEAAGFQEGDEISLESLKPKGLINPSGRDRRLPLKESFGYWWVLCWETDIILAVQIPTVNPPNLCRLWKSLHEERR
ncbi:large ribosomal subunit protein uL15c isoform X1 [Elaeis guineensis]|uniref:50S ribosomal protein L15, chloroplastic isoform X1 n=2 Tax=Elaeis guineensis var. tenera TaxID=51953 RepID=A0A6I9RG46_ELAGV|nr:50S ribosomal protein L15, chloroplastic isoform X1 [Elaeis guineensis]